jgi:hypothetical protein
VSTTAKPLWEIIIEIKPEIKKTEVKEPVKIPEKV